MSTRDSHTPLAPISWTDLVLCYLGELAIARVLHIGFWGYFSWCYCLLLWTLSRGKNHQQAADPDQVQEHRNKQYQPKDRHKRWEPQR